MDPILMATSYSTPYVILSYVISAIGAFVALTASSRISERGQRLSIVNLLAAGLALGGIGVWSMHFIGMLALEVDMGIGYAMPETIASLVIAVAASAFALQLVARGQGRIGHILVGGAVLGAAVCVMHYLGMYGMRFAGFFQWSLDLVGLSLLIAFVAASAALWLAFAVRTVPMRIAASLVMAGAVSAMHYTGMSAASILCTTPNPAAFPQGFGIVSALQLPTLVTVIAVGMAFVISIDQAFQRIGQGSQRKAPAGR